MDKKESKVIFSEEKSLFILCRENTLQATLKTKEDISNQIAI